MSIQSNIKLRPIKDRPYGKSFDPDSSMTKQEFARQCDINRIVSSYVRTGHYENEKGIGMFQDVSNIPDYQSSLQLVINAKRSFEDLDPNLRKRFNNSPQELLEFLQDERNNEEAIKLGLREKPKQKDPEPDPEPIPEPPNEG